MYFFIDFGSILLYNLFVIEKRLFKKGKII
uniref:Uncharacterized protein n=1 Tax=Siphoviridae sp. ctHip2 TaxID=2827830 RepID=A0A8S5RW17_9CAUD|nr:MAG TPA: hypothetical protein [Siphoviridae sp. ctHip2]